MRQSIRNKRDFEFKHSSMVSYKGLYEKKEHLYRLSSMILDPCACIGEYVQVQSSFQTTEIRQENDMGVACIC